MMKHILLFFLSTVSVLGLSAQMLTIDECQQMARDNYPAIKRYDLIAQTTAIQMDNIDKQWLPNVSAVLQGSVQSDVATLPKAMTQMMQQAGYESHGLSRVQYRLGASVSQQVWDGGDTSEQKAIARLQGDINTTQNDVLLYNIRARVNELYFAILLLDERIKLNDDHVGLLTSNLNKLSAMLRHGTAMAADVNSMQAERLRSVQQGDELRATRTTLQRQLALLCGIDTLPEVEQPQPTSPQTPLNNQTISAGEPPALPEANDQTTNLLNDQNLRPELTLYNQQLLLADAQERLLKTRLLPRLSVFAEGYYGYTGYDMFHDMMHRNPTLNGIIGARLTWNIGSLYTWKNDRRRLQTEREEAITARETFLFNNRLQQTEQQDAVRRYKDMAQSDAEIVTLRQQVRRAAESKLNHGIINVNDLMQEIVRENEARIQQSIHRLQALKEMYDWKYTVNN